MRRVVATRRFGTETSKTRATLLDAAEALMLAEGYAAVSSRRVAATAGLKPALVHYYFATMDDLFLALYRRRVDEGLKRQAQALESAQPLWALWEFSRDPRGTSLTMEFVALANHRKAIRAEIAASAERFRAEQLKGLESVLERYSIDDEQCPPIACAVLITSISRVLVIEKESLGMCSGHAETVAFVERFLTQLEGPRQSPTRTPTS
jgi:AcrR family transcriptional regulator